MTFPAIVDERHAEIERLRAELRQCQIELEEVWKYIAPAHPGLAMTYRMAADRVKATLTIRFAPATRDMEHG